MRSGYGAWLAWLLAVAPACFHPIFDRPACSTQGECPAGLVCSAQNFCEPAGTVIIDAGVDASIDAAPPLMAPGCVGLPMTCGPSATDSCCNSPLVRGGTYYRSYDKAGDAKSGTTSFPATVNDFRLDKYEVTVGRFRAFVNAGKGTRSSPPMAGDGVRAAIGAASGWDANWNGGLAASTAALTEAVKCTSTAWTDRPGDNENRPMNCITWFEAMAFCVWDGGFLPTEAEWNYAATGGADQRAYPWSSPASPLTLDAMYASYHDGTNCVGDGMPGCAITDLVPVGTKPAGDGRWGQSDLAGNVNEWTLDFQSGYPIPCTNCANTAGTLRVFRGGSFGDAALYMRAGTRNYYYPYDPSGGIGVRCARTP